MHFDSKKKVYIAVVFTGVGSVLMSVLITNLLIGDIADPEKLVPSVVVPLCIAPLVSFWCFSQAYRIVELNKQLSNLLNHDPLTNAHSRSYFFQIAEDDPAGSSAVTLMIDADHFKQINDTHGHDIGDEALKHFSDQIARNCRKSDVVARLGGEEFAVYMRETDIGTAQKVAERIREAISQSPLVIDGLEIPLSASIGIAPRGSAEQIDEALKRADMALYQAKAEGRNKVRLALGKPGGKDRLPVNATPALQPG